MAPVDEPIPSLTLADVEVHALGERRWFLREGLLGHAAALGVHDAVEALAAAGRPRPAGLGRGAAHRVDEAVRGDLLDRLIVFLSERVEHEVLPTRAVRRAVTAWFRARDPLSG
jgi:hypothetical protein